MIEELYIIKNNNRYKVDLNYPSGITLKFSSPLFEDLSKYECSRSYTFEIPITGNNRNVFDLIEDLRSENVSVGKKYSVEYIIEGMTIIHNGNLYIEEVEGAYKAVMTWNVLTGLKKIQESELNICDICGRGDEESLCKPNPGGQYIGFMKVLEVEDDPNDNYDDDGSGGGDLGDVAEFTPSVPDTSDYD